MFTGSISYKLTDGFDPVEVDIVDRSQVPRQLVQNASGGRVPNVDESEKNTNASQMKTKTSVRLG